MIAAVALALALAAPDGSPPGFVDVRSAGAVGDGASHPLSSRFRSLDEARAAFPRATSLAEELDAHAIQKALDDAPVGGTVWLSPGQYRVNFTLRLWKGVTLSGSGTSHQGPEYGHHAQLLVSGAITGIAFDPAAHPAGVRPKAYAQDQARITGVKLRGESADPAHASVGISFHEFASGEVDHCHLAAFGTAIATNGSWSWSVHDNVMTGCGYAFRHDATFAPAGVAAGGWTQTNAARLERNHAYANAWGFVLFGAGSAISIRDNTLEGCARTALALASYPDPLPGSPDADHGLRSVEVRGNYFERNAIHVELGRDLGAATATARSAPRDVVVAQNSFNLDGLAAHQAVLVHALFSSRIADNGTRYGAGEPVDVAFEVKYADAGVALAEDLDVVAERGWSGYPIFSRDGSCRVRARASPPGGPARVWVSPAHPARARTRLQAYAMQAGSPAMPLESAALLAPLLDAMRGGAGAPAAIELVLAPGDHGEVALPAVAMPLTVRPDPASTQPAVVRRLRRSGGGPLAILGDGRLVVRAADDDREPLRFDAAFVNASDVRVEWRGERGPPGSSALVARDGAVVQVRRLRVGDATPERAVTAAGATVLLLDEPPRAWGAEPLATDPVLGGLIARRYGLRGPGR